MELIKIILKRMGKQFGVIAFMIVVWNFIYFPHVSGQDSIMISLRTGLVLSKMNVVENNYSAGDYLQEGVNVAFAIKKSITPKFNVGLELGFISAYSDLGSLDKNSFQIVDDLVGNFQRNTLYLMIYPEFYLPKIGLYWNLGVGGAYNYTNMILNGTRIIREIDGTERRIYDVTLGSPPGLAAMFKVGMGYRARFSKSIFADFDLSYFETTPTGGNVGYLEIQGTPTIGYRGWIFGASIGMMIGGN